MAGLRARWRHRRQVRRNRRELLLLLLLRQMGETYILHLSGVTGIPVAYLYPDLARLEVGELVQSRWEQPEPDPSGRPRRRLYSTTGNAAIVIPVLVEQLHREWV